MQNQQIPVVGKTYTSQTHPALTVTVLDVFRIYADPENGIDEPSFAVECDKFDFSRNDWNELKFSLATP